MFDQASIPHIDKWKRNVKAFLFLTDVTDENAPFRYWPTSNRRDRPIRFEMDRAFAASSYAHDDGVVAPRVLRTIANVAEAEGHPRVITLPGPRGTIILADTPGIRSGTTLLSGERLQLVREHLAH